MLVYKNTPADQMNSASRFGGHAQGQSVVYDFDTRLGFPCTFSEYVARAIRSEESLNVKYHRLVCCEYWMHVIILGDGSFFCSPVMGTDT